MKYTKQQLTKAMYLLLDEVLPLMNCKLIEERGNFKCDRCDDCMFEQYLKRAKSGELCKKEKQLSLREKMYNQESKDIERVVNGLSKDKNEHERMVLY